MCTRNPRSGAAQGVDGRYNARRSGAPGPHAHGNELLRYSATCFVAGGSGTLAVHCLTALGHWAV